MIYPRSTPWALGLLSFAAFAPLREDFSFPNEHHAEAQRTQRRCWNEGILFPSCCLRVALMDRAGRLSGRLFHARPATMKT